MNKPIFIITKRDEDGNPIVFRNLKFLDGIFTAINSTNKEYNNLMEKYLESKSEIKETVLLNSEIEPIYLRCQRSDIKKENNRKNTTTYIRLDRVSTVSISNDRKIYIGPKDIALRYNLMLEQDEIKLKEYLVNNSIEKMRGNTSAFNAYSKFK